MVLPASGEKYTKVLLISIFDSKFIVDRKNSTLFVCLKSNSSKFENMSKNVILVDLENNQIESKKRF